MLIQMPKIGIQVVSDEDRSRVHIRDVKRKVNT